MGREEQVRDAKCTRPSLPVEGLAPRLTVTMVFDLGTRLLLHCASFFAYGSSILDLLMRPLRRSISEIMDL